MLAGGVDGVAVLDGVDVWLVVVFEHFVVTADVILALDLFLWLFPSFFSECLFSQCLMHNSVVKLF